jgi:hypothetical protein
MPGALPPSACSADSTRARPSVQPYSPRRRALSPEEAQAAGAGVACSRPCSFGGMERRTGSAGSGAPDAQARLSVMPEVLQDHELVGVVRRSSALCPEAPSDIRANTSIAPRWRTRNPRTLLPAAGRSGDFTADSSGCGGEPRKAGRAPPSGPDTTDVVRAPSAIIGGPSGGHIGGLEQSDRTPEGGAAGNPRTTVRGNKVTAA